MKYAYFDPINGMVIAWLDTDLYDHVLPDDKNLYICSDKEWENKDAHPWKVEDGKLVEYTPPEAPKIDESKFLAASVRAQRDMLLDRVYDRGVSMIKRALRMETEEKTISSLNEKLAELDKYAKDLQNIPEQKGFPQDVKWPTQPEAEL